MLQVVAQNTNKLYLVDRFKVIKDDDKFAVLGYDTKSREYVKLGRYLADMVAYAILYQMIKQQFVIFRGGAYYNIYEMPADPGVIGVY